VRLRAVMILYGQFLVPFGGEGGSNSADGSGEPGMAAIDAVAGLFVVDPSPGAAQATDLGLLSITDRTPQTAVGAEDQGSLPCGQGRARRIAFGSAQVRMGAGAGLGDAG
jgi:hypothetical protein